MKKIIFAISIVGVFGMSACNTSALKEKEAAIQAQQRTIDSMNTQLARKHIIDSMNEYTRFQLSAPLITDAAPVINETPRVVYVTQPRKATRRPRVTPRQYTGPVYAQAPVEQKKKGWSAKAKGTVIGAGTGGIAGALINGRNRTAGAIIGTVLGAGAGLGIGAMVDNRNGR